MAIFLTSDPRTGRPAIFVPYKHRPGGIYVAKLDYKQQVFSFDDHKGNEYHWDINTLLKMHIDTPKLFTLMTAQLTAKDIEHITKNNGIEYDHIARVPTRRLDEPGLMVLFPGDFHTIIDGNHRAVKRYKAGLRTMDFLQIPLEASKPAMLDLPRELTPLGLL